MTHLREQELFLFLAYSSTPYSPLGWGDTGIRCVLYFPRVPIMQKNRRLHTVA
jgi:hypothetical protein